MTGRSRERILKEIDRVLGEVFEEDKVEFASLLAVIREKNKDIYTSLLCETLANQKLSDYGKSLFRMNARDMESLYKYVKMRKNTILIMNIVVVVDLLAISDINKNQF